MISIFDLDTYTSSLKHINAYIREYDISKANINILLYYKAIDSATYTYLYSLPKLQREIQVGYMQRNDKTISNILKQGFKEARHMFCEANDIKERDILAIKKDALFLIDRNPSKVSFDNIEFKLKNTYESYYNLANMEFYYTTINEEKIDVKGMSDESIYLHKRYMYDLFCYIFKEALKGSNIDLVNLIREISENYLSGEYGLEFFREFNSRSLFRTNYVIGNKTYYLNSLDDYVSIKDINPIWNYSILQELYKIYISKLL